VADRAVVVVVPQCVHAGILTRRASGGKLPVAPRQPGG
jgi:hypothetical protein